MPAADELDDDLVRLAIQGDPPALARLAACLLPQVRLMVAARLGHDAQRSADVDDIAQVSLSALLAAISRLQMPTVGGLRAYLSALVANKVADFLRSPARRPERQPLSLDSTVANLSSGGALWQLLSASGTSPLSAAARAEHVTRVMAELARLRPEHRDVITLAFFDQLKTAEIAERLSISRPAATMLLTRAIAALRERVGLLA